MKTYKVKNYKGNLVESLSRFQKSHNSMKIVEAVEDGDNLKIKADNSISISYFSTTSKNEWGDNLEFFYFKNEKDIEEFLKAIEDDGYKSDAKDIREDIKQEKIDFPICIYYSDRDYYTFSSEISKDKNKMKKKIAKALGNVNKRLRKIEQEYKEKQKEIKDSEKYGNELLEML